MNQGQLGNELGITHTQVGAYEKGESFPRFENLIKLSEIFNVNIDDLIHQDLTKATARPATTGGEELQDKVKDLLEKRVRELEREIKRRDAGWARELGIE